MVLDRQGRIRDSMDDLAAFLMHRTADSGLSEEDRLSIFVLVGAYQENDDPPLVAAALRTAAATYRHHPDYRSEWAELAGEENTTLGGSATSSGAPPRLEPLHHATTDVLDIAYYESGPT